MVRTVTIDIINEKALQLLEDLENLDLIRMHTNDNPKLTKVNWAKKYKGSMSKQSITDIDKQLKELRDEWD